MTSFPYQFSVIVAPTIPEKNKQSKTLLDVAIVSLWACPLQTFHIHHVMWSVPTLIHKDGL